jgi:hypothetical protein
MFPKKNNGRIGVFQPAVVTGAKAITTMHLFNLRSVLPILLYALALQAAAQPYSQTVRGTVQDADTREALVGAVVAVAGSEPRIATTTDIDGRFTLANVPVGRIDVDVRLMGYEEFRLTNQLVNSAKELVLTVRLQQALTQLQAAEVTGKQDRREVRNDMAFLSARSIGVEETSRMAGGINDPARMVTSFPGVAGDPTGDNSIVVRGNSPKGVLWRLEGVEIPSPNHFSDDGSTGGPINVLNSDMIDNSDFYTGAFPAEYGNATSAVFDMRLRDGNDRKREYTLKAGVIGTDLTAEGPLPGTNGGSYLANYRYSTLALLDQAGIVDYQGVPRYTDAAFKLKLPAGKAGTFALFGVGGRSSILQEERSTEGDTLFSRGDFGSRMGVIGLDHTRLIGDKSFLYTVLSLSGNGSSTDYAETDLPAELPLEPRHVDDLGHWTWRFSTTLNTRLNAAHKLRTGVIVSLDRFRMLTDDWNIERQRMERQLDDRGQAASTQAFVSWMWRWNQRWSLTAGTHFLHFGLDGANSVEPRLGLRFQSSPVQAFTLGAGLHSRMESILTYLAQATDSLGRTTRPNDDLGLTRAVHAVAGYERMLAEDVQLKVEAYYQYLFDQPVEDDASSSFWLGNMDGWFTTRTLVNKGTGRNLGVELSAEKFFTHGWHALATLSLGRAEYKALDGVWRHARFDHGTVGNVLAEKEWKLGPAGKDRVITTGIRYSRMGGQWSSPIDLQGSIAAEEQKDGSPAMSVHGDPIGKLDLALAYRVGRSKVSHEFKADVQNVLDSRTPVYTYYDRRSRSIKTVDQLALLPVVQYVLRF